MSLDWAIKVAMNDVCINDSSRIGQVLKELENKNECKNNQYF